MPDHQLQLHVVKHEDMGVLVAVVEEACYTVTWADTRSCLCTTARLRRGSLRTYRLRATCSPTPKCPPITGFPSHPPATRPPSPGPSVAGM